VQSIFLELECQYQVFRFRRKAEAKQAKARIIKLAERVTAGKAGVKLFRLLGAGII